MVDEIRNPDNRVDRSANGGFTAFWHGQVVYENGRVKKFETEQIAWEFLARCDKAGRIVRAHLVTNWSYGCRPSALRLGSRISCRGPFSVQQIPYGQNIGPRLLSVQE
jgi:hypothetical protein